MFVRGQLGPCEEWMAKLDLKDEVAAIERNWIKTGKMISWNMLGSGLRVIGPKFMGSGEAENLTNGRASVTERRHPPSRAEAAVRSTTLIVSYSGSDRGAQQPTVPVLPPVRVVNLAWSGTCSPGVDVYRNGLVVGATPNDRSHRDTVDRAGTYTYRLCQPGTSSRPSRCPTRTSPAPSRPSSAATASSRTSTGRPGPATSSPSTSRPSATEIPSRA